MVTVTLRAYLAELEGLLKRQAMEEVIGHCRYILQSYPKNVAVYRLLGRALLNRTDQQEALDVFQRVLSAVPDDPTSHRALAELYREQEAFPQAIWHMERAFEIDPNDTTIREALRGLYQRQTGTAPDRLALTRGGLAYMHFRSQLYDQAIAEIQGILAVEPDRIDLVSLLARTMWAYQRPTIAADLALRVLESLQDAIDANEIMARLWLQNRRPTDARPFLERLQALDPFRALQVIKPGNTNAENAIQIPHLDWGTYDNASLINQAPDWMQGLGENFAGDPNSAGSYDPFGLNSQAGTRSDWATGFAAENVGAAAPIDWFSQPDQLIPAQYDPGSVYEGSGYYTNDQNFAPPVQPFAEQSQDFAEAVPDWFTQLDIPGSAATPAAPVSPATTDFDFGVPDYLQADTLPGDPPMAPVIPQSAGEADFLPPWLRDDPADGPASPPPPPAPPKPPTGSLTRLAPKPPAAPPPDPTPAANDWHMMDTYNVPTPIVAPDPFADLWSQPMDESPLDNSAFRQQTVPIIEDPAPEMNRQADWMTNLPKTGPLAGKGNTPVEAPSWLNSLPNQTDSPAKAAEPEAAESFGIELPDWLNDTPVVMPERPEPEIQSPAAGVSYGTQDWLEAIDLPGPSEASTPEPEITPPSEELPAFDLGAEEGWLSEVPHIETPLDQIGPPTTQFDTPLAPEQSDWLSDLGSISTYVDPVEPTAESAESESDADSDTPAWLRELDAAEASRNASDAAGSGSELEFDETPEWLRGVPIPEARLKTGTLPVPEPEQISAQDDMDWLNALSDDYAANDSPEESSEPRPEAAKFGKRISTSRLNERVGASTPASTASSNAEHNDWLGSLRASADDPEPPAAVVESPAPRSFAPELENNFPEKFVPEPMIDTSGVIPDFLTSASENTTVADPFARTQDNASASDWLSGLSSSESAAPTNDWLTQFGVMSDEPTAAPAEPDVSDESSDLPDWLKAPSGSSAFSSPTAPAAESEAPRSGMTAMLGALGRQPTGPNVPAEDVFDATEQPDWLAAFTGEDLPPLEAKEDPAPEPAAESNWLYGPDFNSSSGASETELPISLPPPEVPQTMADSIFNQISSEDGTDWLSAFNPMSFDSEKPKPSASGFQFKQPPAWMRNKGTPKTDKPAGDQPPAQS